MIHSRHAGRRAARPGTTPGPARGPWACRVTHQGPAARAQAAHARLAERRPPGLGVQWRACVALQMAAGAGRPERHRVPREGLGRVV